ncbi:unnamed protein product [Pedinophyceae sp. YPF-701]|nr:unnamed protein product [Pedinophyceae sp. YPF-701]
MDLDAVLRTCLSNDNQKRKEAEGALQAAGKDVSIIPQLITRVCSSEDASVRQIAALFLKKRIGKHWKALDENARTAIKAALLERMLHEPVHPVKTAVMGAASVIARDAVPKGTWPQLLDFLAQCCASQDAEHRHVAMSLFCSLMEYIAEELRPHYTTLQQVFVAGLGDATPAIRRVAVKAVMALMTGAAGDADLVDLGVLVPALAACIEASLREGEDDVAINAFEAVTDAVEFPSAALQAVVQPTVRFALSVACNAEHDLGVREASLSVIHMLASYKPKLLSKSGLAAEVTGNLCKLLCEPDPEDHDESSQASARKFGGQALDEVARGVSSKHVLPTVLSFLESAVHNQDANIRAAGVDAVGIVAEGCSEPLRKKLKVILSVTLAGMNDAEPVVRRKAAGTLGQLAEWLQPDIVEYHQEVIPALFKILHDSDPDVAEAGCYALDTFCEYLGDDILPFVGQLMEALVALLKNSPLRVQELALSAMASIAASAETAFTPHAEQLLPLLHQLMTRTEDDILSARARATECAGLVLQAIGKEQAIKAAGPFVDATMAGFALDFSELREWSYGFFAHLADVLGEDAKPLVSQVVPRALTSCGLQDAVRDKDGVLDLEDSDDDEPIKGFSVRTGVMDEKCAATHCLGRLSRATGPHFMDAMPQAMPVVVEMTNYFHEEVRRQAYLACAGLLIAAYKGWAVRAIDDDACQEMSEQLMGCIVGAFSVDDDMSALASALDAADEVIKEIGAEAMEKHLLPLVRICALVLEGDTIAQQAAREDSDDEIDGENDDAEELLTSASDLIATIAGAFGAEAFAPVMREHIIGPLRGLMRPEKPASARQIAIGCFAECVEVLQARAEDFVEEIVPVLLRELRSEESENRRNAAFCSGILFLHCMSKVSPR